ncbi:MAG: hypothetical protein JSS30_00995 [Verrucomicrobia bacterium]|nr:hypothetical protein [Verrucomicrobiota bacterium]
MGKTFAILLLLLNGSLSADECPAILEKPIKTKKYGELRTKTIKAWDKLMTWALLPKNGPYILVDPPIQSIFKRTGESLPDFVKNYGYFSFYHPILGIVTDSAKDIDVVQCLLKAIQQDITDPVQLQFTSDEILAKVVAYRTFKKGMKITLPHSEEAMVTYVVDFVIDMWRGMPAYGLIPENSADAVPILLFRGTDLDLATEKSWASVLSDLDTAGPGHRTFMRARGEIHDWLVKVGNARIVGFSLGGVLTLYTLIYEHEWINKNVPSTAFNPPGVSNEVLDIWEKIPQEDRPPHIIYVNEGDFVSQIGLFLGNVYAISLKEPMEVIAAHVTLISGEPLYKISKVNVPLENQARK